MRIKVQTDENMFAVGSCPYSPNMIVGGCSCKNFCKYHIANDYKSMEVECGYPGAPQIPYRENPNLKEDDDRVPLIKGIWDEEE